MRKTLFVLRPAEHFALEATHSLTGLQKQYNRKKEANSNKPAEEIVYPEMLIKRSQLLI